MLTIQHISKKFKENQALDDVSLVIPKGSCYGLIGPNGAGKSTLMKIITRIIQADKGKVKFNGIKEHSHMKQRIGYVPQEISLEQTLTAKENLYFFGRLYGLRGSLLKERVDKILDHINLTEQASKKVQTYSGGMKRRLNIGCALVNNPSFILMDEPTVGIDPQSRKYIFEMINRLINNGNTIIYASHYIKEVEKLCDRVALIDHGKIVASGLINTLLESHTQSTVFVQGKNCLPPSLYESSSVHEKNKGYLIYSDNPLTIMKKIIQFNQQKSQQLNRLELAQPELEDVFFSLTGNMLRD